MMTSREIARLAGVSQATVSRVLQGAANVSEKTRKRVEQVMQETGYFPNAQARAMRTSRSHAIGVVTGRITNPFYPELLTELTRRITAADYRMPLWIADEAAGARAAVDAVRSRSVDALIFTTAAPGSEPMLAALDIGLPVVLVNRTIEPARFDQVSGDNVEGGRLVARYLLAHGIVDVAVIGGSEPISTGQERRLGFLSEFSAAGVDIPEHRQPRVEFLHDAGRDAAAALLSSEAPPRALFCLNDLLAFGAIGAARNLGLSVPDDVWVIGYDDIPSASWEVFDLTTIRQTVGTLADAAVELALRRIKHPDTPFEHRRFAPELIIRGSTGHRAR